MSAREMTPDEVREVRHRLGLSQDGLAERLGVSRSTIARWEMDRRSDHARRPSSMAKAAMRRLIETT